MASMEEDFPRGGITKKTTESKPQTLQTEVDNLFQSHDEPDTKKRKAQLKDEGKKYKKPKTGTEKAASLTLNAASKCVEILHAKNVKEGMLMLGCVMEVSDFDVTVGLPCGLQGFVNIKNICDSYTKILTDQLDSDDTEEIYSLPNLFYPGMLVRCVVARMDVAKGGSNSIQLSFNPKLVNKALSSGTLKAGMILSGFVASVEDHGYIVDIGMDGTNAFMPKQAVKDQHNNAEELKVGQYVTAHLDEVKNNGRMVRLSVGPLPVDKALAEARHGWTLTNLLPGLLVQAKIKMVTKHGLIVSFLSFGGQVDFLHMEPEHKYSVGDEVRACVLYMDPTTRLVALSLRSHLLQLGAPVEVVPADGGRVGEVVEGCKLKVRHHNSGAMLEQPNNSVAFVHKYHLKEAVQSADVNKRLSLEVLTCRILTFSPMDQIHFASLRRSVIDKPFFRYCDIQVGQVVEGTVSALLEHGMKVKVSDQIRGFVPKTHLSDILLKNPAKKYTEGMKVKCRVLSVDPERKNLILTRKKSLVNSTLPLFLTYADARRGRVSHGYIVCVKDFGCIVRFYNNVKGLVPVKELSSEPIVRPEEVFYIGQVLKTRVLHCDPEKERIALSFKEVVEDDAEEPAKPQFVFEVGKNVEVKVLKKTIIGLTVAILPNDHCAVLPIMHLSDHMSNCPLLWEGLQEGDTISNLICLTKNKDNLILTKKPMVKCFLAEGVVAKEFSDLVVGMQLIGWIKNIMPYGVFVEFPYGLVGLAPKSAMSDRFITDVTTAFQCGQTVFAKVTNLDEEKRRFLVSLKLSEVATPDGDAQTRLIAGLRERKAVGEMVATKAGDSDLRHQLCLLTVGQKLKVTVDDVKTESASFKSDELAGATILATKYNFKGIGLSPGQKVNAVILHVDVMSCHVHVSILPSLVAKKKSLTEGSKYSVTVQHMDKEFATVLFHDMAQLTVIQTTSHLNEIRAESEMMKLGQNLTATVLEASCQELEGLPLVSWERAAPKRQHTASESQATSKGHCYGETVKGKVQTVKPTCVLVALEDGSTGSVHVSQVSEDVCPGTFPTSSLKVGSQVTARVIGGREVTSHRFLPFTHPKFSYSIPELTLLPSKINESAEFKPVKPQNKLSSYKVGQTITCFVSKYYPDKKYLEVTTDPCITGTVDLLSMITDLKKATHPEKLYKQGQALRATVVEVSSKPQRFSLSLTDVHALKTGSVTLGMVINKQPNSLLVKLPCGAMGTVSIVDLADTYRADPLAAYSKDQLVRCYLLGKENDKWQLSLRQSRLNPEQATSAKDPEVFSIDELKEGQVIRGYVTSVGTKGVFIRLSRSVVGRADLQHATKYYFTSPSVITDNLPLNTLLTTNILSIDKEEQIVSLSLLSEHTGKPDVLPASLCLKERLTGEHKEKEDAQKKRKSPKDDADQVPKKKNKKTKKGKAEDSDSGVEVYFREEEEVDKDKLNSHPAKRTKKQEGPAKPSLQVSAGFSWDVGLNSLKPASAAQEAEASDGEEQEGSSTVQKKSRHELEQQKKEAEKALVRREVELMDPNLRPQDAGAFERLLLASPNSSLLWLQYMAHHLQATQIEQARAVAERALKTISFREEQEKLNVWVALLNLENMYGTDDSLKQVFERAVQFCEPMPVYQQLADIYTNSNKTKEAEGLYKMMVKRFRQNKAVWLSYGSFLLRQGQGDAAGTLLQRALKSLPANESVDVISKFAQLEFRYGNVERGRSMFDKVLTSYPKRTDLWSVFIDLMIKHGSQEDVRALFDRVIHLSIAVKKVKFFFKRYLEYEKKHGTPDHIQTVKQKALEFVECKGTEAAC